MKENGQFDVPGNTKVEVEFTCPKCGKKVKGIYKIKSEPHADETAACDCGESYDITVMRDAGTGTVHVHALGDNQKAVKAQGLP